MSAVPVSMRFNYDDYVELPEDRRFELIDGGLHASPAPTPFHQMVLTRLLVALDQHVRARKLGTVLPAPCDVVLSFEDVLQPDLLFIARSRRRIIGATAIREAPDLVVEVLSKKTAKRDEGPKLKLYSAHGVKELWLVDPVRATVDVYVRGPKGLEKRRRTARGETLVSDLLPGLSIPLASVFQRP